MQKLKKILFFSLALVIFFLPTKYSQALTLEDEYLKSLSEPLFYDTGLVELDRARRRRLEQELNEGLDYSQDLLDMYRKAQDIERNESDTSQLLERVRGALNKVRDDRQLLNQIDEVDKEKYDLDINKLEDEVKTLDRVAKSQKKEMETVNKKNELTSLIECQQEELSKDTPRPEYCETAQKEEEQPTKENEAPETGTSTEPEVNENIPSKKLPYNYSESKLDEEARDIILNEARNKKAQATSSALLKIDKLPSDQTNNGYIINQGDLSGQFDLLISYLDKGTVSSGSGLIPFQPNGQSNFNNANFLILYENSGEKKIKYVVVGTLFKDAIPYLKTAYPDVTFIDGS